MEQYIKKSALVAEIDKEIKRIYAGREYVGIPLDEENKVYGLQMAKDIIDTLKVKESLTWQDIRLISEIGESFMNSEESDNLNEKEYYSEILSRFKVQKGESV